MPVRLKSAYSPYDTEDGLRYMAETLWPEGVETVSLSPYVWIHELAPSYELKERAILKGWTANDFRSQYYHELLKPERRDAFRGERRAGGVDGSGDAGGAAGSGVAAGGVASRAGATGAGAAVGSAETGGGATATAGGAGAAESTTRSTSEPSLTSVPGASASSFTFTAPTHVPLWLSRSRRMAP